MPSRIARQVQQAITQGKTLAEIVEMDIAARSTVFKVAKEMGVSFKRPEKRNCCPHCGGEL